MKHTFARGSRFGRTRVTLSPYHNLTHFRSQVPLDYANLHHNLSHFHSQLPFDYTNTQGDEFAIALLKVPANISTSDPAYRGPVLVNPGGPGGSGVDFALHFGSLSQTLIGADYDIIGFDPRGK